MFNVSAIEDTGILLTETKSCDIDFETVVRPPYIKGDPMKWITMTEEEKTSLISSLSSEINSELILTEDTDDTNEYNDVF